MKIMFAKPAVKYINSVDKPTKQPENDELKAIGAKNGDSIKIATGFLIKYMK